MKRHNHVHFADGTSLLHATDICEALSFSTMFSEVTLWETFGDETKVTYKYN